MPKPESILENETHKILRNFLKIQTDRFIPAKRLVLMIANKKRREPANNRMKRKEREKRDKYLDLTREPKKLCNMKLTVKPVIISAHGTVLFRN